VHNTSPSKFELSSTSNKAWLAIAQITSIPRQNASQFLPEASAGEALVAFAFRPTP